MVNYMWYKQSVPNDLKVRQVYGIKLAKEKYNFKEININEETV